MQNFNIDGSGQKIYVDFGQDISTYTALSLIMEPQTGSKITVTPTLGTEDADVDDQTYSANEYVYFSLTADIFPVDGLWKVKAVATLPAEEISTNYDFFRVMP
jgi:hypothetical protein